MSAFSKFMKLFSMAGGVQSKRDPVTGRIGIKDPSNGQDLQLSLPSVFSGCRRPASSTSPQTAFAAYTWGLKLTVPSADVCAIRFALMASPDGAATYKGLVGIQSAWNNAHTPDYSVAATWGGGDKSTITIPQYTAVGAGDWAKTYPLYWSDFMPIQPVARSDGGTDSILLVRVYSADSSINCSGHSSDDSHMSNVPMPYHTAFQSGDYVASPAGFNGGGSPSCCPVVMVEYLTQSGGRQVSIAEFTDSIGAGEGTTKKGYGSVAQTCETLNAQLGAHAVPQVSSVSGNTTAESLRRFVKVVNSGAGLPDYAIWRPYTRNDGGDLISYIGRTATFIETCFANKITPILQTGFYESVTPANNANMVTVNAWTRQAASKYGLMLIDLEPLITASNASALLSDGIHPNDAGQLLLVNSGYVPVLSAIF